MLAAFLACAMSVEIKKVNLSTAQEIMKSGETFILAAPTTEFEYATISRAFIRGAHLSTVDANYIIIDTSKEEDAMNALQVQQFPVLLFAKDGQILKSQYRGFDEEFVIAFINTNSIDPISTVNTASELEKVYQSSACALLVAIKDASVETLPEVNTFYRSYVSQVSVYFVNPELMEEEGFYLYRFLDSELIKLDVDGKDVDKLARAIGEASVPEFPKLTNLAANKLEAKHKPFAVLLLAMDDFYLNQEQLDIARNLSAKLNISVCYADIENSQIPSIRYGLPDSLDSTMAVVDATGSRLLKYMISDALTVDSALTFVEEALAGKVKPFWRSEIEMPADKGSLTAVTADSLVKIIDEKKDATIALYMTNKQLIEGFVNATKPLLENPVDSTIYGMFSMGLNDWSGPELKSEEIPYLISFKKGKLVFEETLGETEEEVNKQLKAIMALNVDEL